MDKNDSEKKGSCQFCPIEAFEEDLLNCVNCDALCCAENCSKECSGCNEFVCPDHVSECEYCDNNEALCSDCTFEIDGISVCESHSKQFCAQCKKENSFETLTYCASCKNHYCPNCINNNGAVDENGICAICVKGSCSNHNCNAKISNPESVVFCKICNNDFCSDCVQDEICSECFKSTRQNKKQKKNKH